MRRGKLIIPKDNKYLSNVDQLNVRKFAKRRVVQLRQRKENCNRNGHSGQELGAEIR